MASISPREIMLYSIQLEKHLIGGLINHPDCLADIDTFVSFKDFHSDVHQTIYSCLRDSILKKETVDKVMLAQKIKNLGITFKTNVSIFDYIDSITYTEAKNEVIVNAAREIVKFRVLRELEQTSEKIKEEIQKNKDKDINEIVAEIDKIYGDKINSYSFDEQPEPIFEGMLDEIEATGNNPVDEVGLKTPFKDFNRLYGGLRSGNVYAFCSRPGQGKTTLLNFFAKEAGRINNVPVLVLDTEMTTKEQKFRVAAAETGVPLWYLETGNWRKNAEMTKKVRESLKDVTGKSSYDHLYVGNKTIDEVMSIVRRWHLNKVGRGNKCIIVYDYIKLTGEKLGNNWAEHQAVGEKINKIKLLSVELDSPILTAMQINRGGEGQNRSSSDMLDDSSVIATSDRLQWFATFVSIFRRKTPDEVALDTEESGTHKLIPTKTRYQGRDAEGFQDFVSRVMEDGKSRYVRNYLNFRLQNFRVEECGTIHDSIRRQAAILEATDENPNDASGTL